MNNERIIRVKGRGEIQVRPDTTRISITLEGKYSKYNEVLRKSTQDTEILKNMLAEFGVERSDVKTLRFEVHTEFELNKEKMFKRRFVGYKYEHMMKIEFLSDHDKLGKILYRLSNCSLDPEVKISYTIKDPEAAKNKLLAKAVNDAKEKAVILAQAADVRLKSIQSIDYSWKDINFEINAMNNIFMEDDCLMEDMLIDEDSYNLDIEPDDFNVFDVVTVVWEIE